MIAVLNGVEYTEKEIGGLDSIVVTNTRRGSDGKKKKSITSSLIFSGQAYDDIKANLVDDPLGKNKSLPIIIYDDCCKDEFGNNYEAFVGVIRGDEIEWCDDECQIESTPIEETEDTLAMDCVKSTLIYDNSNGFQNQNHPRMTYCVELRPSFIQDVLIIIGIILDLILIILTPIVAVLSVIIITVCFLVNLFGGNCPDELEDGILDDFREFRDRLKENIIGCGRQHPSPLVRSYLNNVCEICGLTLRSSVFNDPISQYHNTVYYYAPAVKGTRDFSVKYILDNKPILMGEGLLDQLANIINGEWDVKNGELILERKDYFWLGTIWVSVPSLKSDGRIINTVCYSWQDEDKPAYGRFAYTEDPVDWVGNEARELYSDIVEWNNPFNDLQRGSQENIFPFGMCRFRGDGIDRDVLGDYENAPFVGPIISQYNDVIIMNNGTCFNPKLLIWDGNSLTNSKVQKYNVPGFIKPAAENFNYPYLCNEFNVPNNSVLAQNAFNVSLYGRFWTLNHPKAFPDNGKDFKFQFSFECDHLREFDLDKNVAGLEGLEDGRIDEVQIDHGQRTILVTGKF